jgi:hypothetical protein
VQKAPTDGVRYAPWENKALGVVSLETVLNFGADVFCAVSDITGRVVGLPWITVGQIVQNEEYMKEIFMRLGLVKKQCVEHGWEETAIRIGEVEEYMGGGQIMPAVFQSKMADLQSHIHRLVRDQLFFCVSRADAEQCFDWADETRPWRELFPNAYFELHLAGECYMFGKAIATVFHSMRAMEIALQALARELDVSFEREQWETLINNIEAKIRKVNGPDAGPDWRKKQENYSEAALHFRYLKNAWRNHVMHVRHDYEIKEAKVICQQSHDFLSDLTRRMGLREALPQPRLHK